MNFNRTPRRWRERRGAGITTVRRRRRVAICWLVAGLGSAVLPACNTMEGAGKDVEKAGEAVQDAAK